MLPLAFGLLGFINLTGEGATIFYWLQAFSGLAVLFTWGSICIAHIRFRMAWKAKGHTPDEIPFKALGGVYGSYIGLAIVLLIMVAEVRQFNPPLYDCWLVLLTRLLLVVHRHCRAYWRVWIWRCQELLQALFGNYRHFPHVGCWISLEASSLGDYL